MAQRVRVTLRAKLLVLMLALILSSILGYLVLAVRLFDKDKKVDIYENNLFLVKSLASQIETGLAHNIRTLRLLATTAGTPTTDLAAIFHENDELVEVRVYLNKPEGTPLLHLRNDKYLEQYGLDAAYLESLSVKRPFPLERVREQKLWVQNASLPNGAPLLGVALALHSLAPGQPLLWVLAYVRQDQVLRLLSESPVYTMMLIDSYGKLLAHSDAQRAMQLEARADESVVSEILRDQKSGSGTREIASEKDASSQIFSHAKLGLGGLYLVSQISKDKAFLGSKLLMEKSFLVALLVILAASMGSILFSRSLTRALEKLYQATQRVAEGDLDQNVSVDSKDEIGSLARVFNRMIQEIKRLLAETADKARMEKELETARLVQDNLFPEPELRLDRFELVARCTPASECGGDWWGHFLVGRQLVVLVGDATGHGVPAALITAAAQSCCTTLAKIKSEDPRFEITPKRIMGNLNSAIYSSARGKVKMSFIVSTIDLDTGELRYCNASHEMPLIRKAVPAGEALEALTGDPDPILGESLESRFSEHRYQLVSGDQVLWYTDGLTEGTNPQGEEWSESRLIRALAKSQGQDARALLSEILNGAGNFYSNAVQSDDITLVVGRYV